MTYKRWPIARKGQEGTREYNLGKWCVNQRRVRNGTATGRLTPQRIEMLDNLGFVWIIFDEVWQKQYGKVKQYIDKYKKWPSPHSPNIDTRKLGRWCQAQRDLFRHKPHALAEARIELLGKIGFVFEIDRDGEWQSTFIKVKEFNKKNGRFPSMSRTVDIYERKLGNWCKSQRSRKGQLTQQRIALLDQIGFIWGNSGRWMSRYEKVCVFLKTYKRWPSAHSKNAQEARLGSWCSTQRRRRNKGEIITEEQITLLNKLKIKWEHDYNDQWMNTYNDLKKFIKKHKRWPSVSEYSSVPDDLRLGRWCINQRIAKKGKGGRMNAERIRLLNDVGFVWEVTRRRRA